MIQRRLPKEVSELAHSMQAGSAPDGQPVNVIHLVNRCGITATFMDLGATWLSCTIPIENKHREVLLGASNINDHKRQNAYLGATVGRFANRIAGGRFALNSKEFQVNQNEGENCLHGGVSGFNRKRWNIESQTDNEVVFSLFSPDGDEGFPGNLEIKVRYHLNDDNALCIDYQASCDKDCPVNLTNHAYFNLNGESSGSTSLEHKLMLAAPFFLPTDKKLIPTGDLRAVTSTGFDFSKEKLINRDFLMDTAQQQAKGYDHCFVLDKDKTDGQQVIAKLVSPDGKLAMTVGTTMPAIQVYTGNYLAGTPGRTREYPDYAGIALETQFLPDGPNHPQWLDSQRGVLLKGQSYQHVTRYCFEVC